MKNWKTNLAGIVVFAIQFGGVFGLPPKAVQTITGIGAAFGLAAAKDSNVTGGSVQQ